MPIFKPNFQKAYKECAHVCMDAYAPNVNAYVLFGQKPKIDFFPLFGGIFDQLI